MSKSASLPRRRFTPVALVAGLSGSLALALGMGASLSGLTATITNTMNTAATAAMAIQETSGALQCNSYDATATCSTINKYGGTATPLVPGGSQNVTITLKNAGTVNAATATLAPGACSATTTGVIGAQTPTTPNTSAGNLCSQVNIAIYKGTDNTGAVVYNGTAAAFTATVNLGALNAGAQQSYYFVVSLPSGATTATQGQQILQQLVWTYNQ